MAPATARKLFLLLGCGFLMLGVVGCASSIRRNRGGKRFFYTTGNDTEKTSTLKEAGKPVNAGKPGKKVSNSKNRDGNKGVKEPLTKASSPKKGNKAKKMETKYRAVIHKLFQDKEKELEDSNNLNSYLKLLLKEEEAKANREIKKFCEPSSETGGPRLPWKRFYSELKLRLDTFAPRFLKQKIIEYFYDSVKFFMTKQDPRAAEQLPEKAVVWFSTTKAEKFTQRIPESVEVKTYQQLEPIFHLQMDDYPRSEGRKKQQEYCCQCEEEWQSLKKCVRETSKGKISALPAEKCQQRN